MCVVKKNDKTVLSATTAMVDSVGDGFVDIIGRWCVVIVRIDGPCHDGISLLISDNTIGGVHGSEWWTKDLHIVVGDGDATC